MLAAAALATLTHPHPPDAPPLQPGPGSPVCVFTVTPDTHTTTPSALSPAHQISLRSPKETLPLPSLRTRVWIQLAMSSNEEEKRNEERKREKTPESRMRGEGECKYGEEEEGKKRMNEKEEGKEDGH